MMLKTYRDHSMMFTGVSVITCKLPATDISGRAGQRQSYRGASSLSIVGVGYFHSDGCGDVIIYHMIVSAVRTCHAEP